MHSHILPICQTFVKHLSLYCHGQPPNQLLPSDRHLSIYCHGQPPNELLLSVSILPIGCKRVDICQQLSIYICHGGKKMERSDWLPFCQNIDKSCTDRWLTDFLTDLHSGFCAFSKFSCICSKTIPIFVE